MASWLFGLKLQKNTSTFSKSLKLELIYLVINKSGQLLKLLVCVIFLIRFEVSQPAPTLHPPPPPTPFFFLLFPILSISGLKSRRISLKLWLTCRLNTLKGFIFVSIPDDFFIIIHRIHKWRKRGKKLVPSHESEVLEDKQKLQVKTFSELAEC